VFDTKPIAFAVRDAVAGTDLDAIAQSGQGMALWLHAADAQNPRTTRPCGPFADACRIYVAQHVQCSDDDALVYPLHLVAAGPAAAAR
jgi:hypothetical protein